MVTVLFGSSIVPGSGDCRTTVPAGWVEFGAVLVTTWKLCSLFWASASDMPVTLGTLIFFGPVETSSVTTLFGATLVPNGGLVWVTRPALTDGEDTLTTFGVSPAFWIAATALL